MKWTIEDMNRGSCDLEDIGNERPVESAAAPVIDLTDVSLRERLRDDALRAYAELGGVEYLKRNPELLDKILAKAVVPEPAPPTVNVGFPEMPWISARRLIYQEAQVLAEDIKEKALPLSKPDEGRKDPT
ncbi:hypothetical protein J7E49_21470 [Variovorax paradoxus]|nr:hypothetical protein [Variovorax paradoxus]